MSQAILQMQGVSKTFPGVKALDQATLNVYPGEVMALLGENGAGKSTLMKVLTGIYHADSGSIHYFGSPMTFAGPRDSMEQGISIIHQELNLIEELSIAENIFLGRELCAKGGRIDWPAMYREADKLLAHLKVGRSSREQIKALSLGEKQMVEIAKALSFEAKVIIMDEPTDALTLQETESLFKVINELREQGRGIVYISHRLSEIFQICDKLTVLRDGEFIAEREVAEMDEDAVIELMVGRRLDEYYPTVEASQGRVSLKVDKLSGPGVNKVSFELHEGEILGFSGLMGAGRSELMRLLFGDTRKTAGSVSLYGESLNLNHPSQGIAAGISYISEDRKGDGLVLGMSVKTNMSLSALAALSHAGGHIKRGEEAKQVARFIDAFNIKTPSEEQIIGNLSGGNQQKVAIAKGLMTEPKVLILDEPTRGVDVGAKKEIYELINQFKQRGMSILLISSDMPEVLGMSDRILVMHEGQISGEFDVAEATQEGLLAAAVGRNE